MAWWVGLYFDYTSYIMGCPFRHGWPDGEPVDRQPALLVNMFDEIESGIMTELRLDAK